MRHEDDVNLQDEITSLVLSCLGVGVAIASCFSMWLNPNDLPSFWWYIVLTCATFSIGLGIRSIRRLLK